MAFGKLAKNRSFMKVIFLIDEYLSKLDNTKVTVNNALFLLKMEIIRIIKIMNIISKTGKLEKIR
jgi:hypothetical protein